MYSVGAGWGAQHLADWEKWVLLTSAAVEAGQQMGPQSADGGFCAQHDQVEQSRRIEVLLDHDADRMG